MNVSVELISLGVMAKQFTGIDGAFSQMAQESRRLVTGRLQATAEVLNNHAWRFPPQLIYGIQSFTGSCTIYYYEQDGATIEGSALMSDVIPHNADAD